MAAPVREGFKALDESALDLLPEYCHYQDDGCEFADSCLNCPFPECIYAQPGGRQQWLKNLRDREVFKLFSSRGKGVKELAEMFGVSQRTIQRIVKRARDGSSPKIKSFGGANG
jgi:hypothetical protein